MSGFAVIEEVEEVDEELLDIQRNFAAGLLSGKYTPHELAAMLYPDNSEMQLHVSMVWPNSAEIVTIKKQLVKEFGHDYFLPTLEEIAQDLYQLSKTSYDQDVKRKSLVDYAKLRGFMDGKAKGTKNIINFNDNSVTQNTQQIDNSKVMVIQDFGTDKQHAAGLEAQQKRLRSGSL